MNFKNIFKILIYCFALVGFVFVAVFFAMQFGWLNVKGSVSERNSYFQINDKLNLNTIDTTEIKDSWKDTADWALLKEVFTRDQDVINRAAHDAGISPRLILGGVMGEQLRFFSNRRESFKNYFEPMKILATLSKFSFGIAGLKPQTVALIDEHLKNSKSVYYLGPEMEHIADYATDANIDSEIMTRITNTKDPYYSYLYVGLYMRQVVAQWKAAGYDISERPEVIATLYNLGFNRSIPKPDAKAGGADITIGGKVYTFGDIAYEFYYSDELTDIFPR
ncbi:MAG: hypothetical protein WCI93_00525 [bacterium]